MVSAKCASRPTVNWLTAATLLSMVVAYCGRLVVSSATCVPMTPPMAMITPMASSTASSAEGTRPRCARRSSATSGASTKASSSARVTGTSTSLPKYSVATMPMNRIITLEASVVAAPSTGLGDGSAWVVLDMAGGSRRRGFTISGAFAEA